MRAASFDGRRSILLHTTVLAHYLHNGDALGDLRHTFSNGLHVVGKPSLSILTKYLFLKTVEEEVEMLIFSQRSFVLLPKNEKIICRCCVSSVSFHQNHS